MAEKFQVEPTSLDVDEKVDHSGLHDTMALFELSELEVGSEADVTLVGTSKVCRERFRLMPGKSTIGRQPGLTIVIQHPGVSRTHAAIEIGADGVRVTDLESGNGTFVNGKRVQESLLENGDTVKFGKQARFLVAIKRRQAQLSEDTAPLDPPAMLQGDTEKFNPRVAVLEQERRQLAILFQLALRYLERGSDDPIDVLFAVLDRIVLFDAAFIAIREHAGHRFIPHPAGKSLEQAEYAKLLEDHTPDAARALDRNEDTLNLSALRVRSRAYIPLKGNGCLVFLCKTPHALSPQLDFLSLLGKLYSTAVG